DIAYKLVTIGLTICDLVNQEVFPKMVRDKSKSFLKKLIKLIIGLSLIFILGYFLVGEFVIDLLSQGQLINAYSILLLMSLSIPIYGVGAMLGRNCLNIYGFDKEVLNSMILSSFLYVVIYVFINNVLNYNLNIYGF